MEQRPFLDEQTLSIITHIPSGRALNCYVEFLHSVIKFREGGGSISKIMENKFTLENYTASLLKKLFESIYQHFA